MAVIAVNTDIKLVVLNSTKRGPAFGSHSDYVETPHPGSGKKIRGWEFDNRRWPGTDTEYQSAVTGLTNPDLSLIDSVNFQSGIGYTDDCEVQYVEERLSEGFIEDWIPVVKHGAWFDHEKEYYLFGDAHRCEFADVAHVTSGSSYIDLLEYPKDGVPILCRTYEWDTENEQYLTYINYAKKVHFTGEKATPTSPRESTWDNNTKTITYANIDTTKNEFLLLHEGHSPPRIVFNKTVTTAVGHAVSVGADLLDLEEVGIGDGSEKLLFHTRFSPIDKTQTIQVYTYTVDINTYQLWTARVNTSLVHAGHECIVDTDLGTIQFGDTEDGDAIPPANAHVLIRYTYTADAIFETPDSDSLHTATNTAANANPFSRTNDRGFVIINRQELSPATVELEADTTLISADLYGPIDIGNILLGMRATVLSAGSTPIEHVKVDFTLLPAVVGNFTNGTDSISTYTDNLGVARAYYATPNSIDDVSEFITLAKFATGGGNTTLHPTTIKVTDTLRDVFLYAVYKDDPFQGIDIGDQVDLDAGIITSELDDWYKDFFLDEEIYGPTGIDEGTGDPTTPLASGATWWENRRRYFQRILTPTSYNRILRNGRKQIVSTWNATALNPHYDLAGVLVPLTPSLITNLGPTDNTVRYDGVILTAPETGDLDGYLLISPTEVEVQATVTDNYLNKTIYSNTITIKLQISDALNGTVYIDDFNDIPENTVPYVLNSGDNGKIIPLGFKIRETGNTLASAIQRVTYVDINPQPTLTMTFNVDKLI